MWTNTTSRDSPSVAVAERLTCRRYSPQPWLGCQVDQRPPASTHRRTSLRATSPARRRSWPTGGRDLRTRSAASAGRRRLRRCFDDGETERRRATPATTCCTVCRRQPVSTRSRTRRYLGAGPAGQTARWDSCGIRTVADARRTRRRRQSTGQWPLRWRALTAAAANKPIMDTSPMTQFAY